MSAPSCGAGPRGRRGRSHGARAEADSSGTGNVMVPGAGGSVVVLAPGRRVFGAARGLTRAGARSPDGGLAARLAPLAVVAGLRAAAVAAEERARRGAASTGPATQPPIRGSRAGTASRSTDAAGGAPFPQRGPGPLRPLSGEGWEGFRPAGSSCCTSAWPRAGSGCQRLPANRVPAQSLR